MTGMELVLAPLDLAGRTERLARLEPEELRKKAVTACRDQDVATLWDITEAYLVTRGRKGARISPRTLETYRDSVEQFMAWAVPAGVQLLRPRASEGFAFVRQLEESGFKPSSVQVRLSGARALYAALRWCTATEASPFEDVRAARDPRAAWEKRGPYSDTDVEKLLAKADPQERVAVLLAADCGLRNSELVAVHKADLRLDDEHPHLMVRGKGRAGYREAAPLSQRAEQAIRTWLPSVPDKEPHLLLWRTRKTVRDHILSLCERAGVRYEGREVHGLRHTAGTRAYLETGDILEARDLLRHRDISSTQVYVQYARRGKKAANRDW